MKLTKELIEKVRSIDGFPIGTDEDIIELSQSPYYTACPNPLIEDFIKEHGKPYDEETDDYHKEPFSFDVSEDKHDLIYNIHSYHTKVPPKAIKNYIEHYTKPGEIVLDTFCGTGMTGVAAQICDDGEFNKSQRYSILIDLSSIATFISYNYNKPIELNEIVEIQDIITKLNEETSDLYLTEHTHSNENIIGFDGTTIKGIINYTVWSDVFICSNCSSELVYFDVAVNDSGNKTSKNFNCPFCGITLTKAKCERAISYDVDPVTNSPLAVTKSIPVLINYSVNKKRYFKKPDAKDIAKIESIKINYDRLPNRNVEFQKGDKTSEMFRGNLKYVWQIYRKRTLHVVQNYLDKSRVAKSLFLLTSALPKLNIMNRYMPEHGSRALVGPMAGTFYLPALSVENNVIHQLEFQFKKLQNLRYNGSKSIVSLQSATSLIQVPSNSIDYVFIDPPFGANIMYSELNSISESWLKIFTNNKKEAIININQKKSLVDYQVLMNNSFSEICRVLKPNRWVTVEFHNSKNSVWNAIHESINRSGLIVADVRILNKEKKTINQFNTKGAVDQDLVISAYKPKESFRREFVSHQGTVQTAWDFVRQHLEKLPIVVVKNEKIEAVVERQAFLLFDRMIAYHIINGILVPLDAADFYKGLDERFIKRDGMYFLHDQVNEYDNARIKTEVEDIQFSFFVSNEKTAIAWLYQQLIIPQTYAEIQPKFMQEIRSIEKHEELPELSSLLEDNFLKEDSGKWYIPDTNKAVDVMRLREKKLVKEFEEYLNIPGKLKKFRTEAIRAGFAKLWKDRNYDLDRKSVV